MASKTLKLNVGGQEVAASLESKISKDDLYGRVDHVVELDGKRLERGWLLPDGVTFRKSQVAMTSVDPEGSPAESPEIHCAGQKLELRPSSFDGAENLEPVPLETLRGIAFGRLDPEDGTAGMLLRDTGENDLALLTNGDRLAGQALGLSGAELTLDADGGGQGAQVDE